MQSKGNSSDKQKLERSRSNASSRRLHINKRLSDFSRDEKFVKYDDSSDDVSDEDECSYRPLDSPSPSFTDEDLQADTRLDLFFEDQVAMDDPPPLVQERPRPPSATQFASSMLKKATSVVHEYSNAASSVVQEVKDVIIKHGYCGQVEEVPRSNISEKTYGTVPLRQIQSSPTHTQLTQQKSGLLEPPPYMVRRSASTPTTSSFQQSLRGSAFGRVQSNSSLVGSNPVSAFQPIAFLNMEDKPECDTSSKLRSKASQKIDNNVIEKIKERRKRLGLGKKLNTDVVEKASSASTRSKVENLPAFDSSADSGEDLDNDEQGLVDEKISGLSYVPLEADINEPNDYSVDPELPNFRKKNPISGTSYQKIDDDSYSPRMNPVSFNPPLPSKPRRSLTLPGTRQVVTPVPRIDSSSKGGSSPSSYDSCSNSRTTHQSNNTSYQTTSTIHSGHLSSNRSVTSSVAEADREVRDTNRRELMRKGGVDLDGNVSIHSSDTASTRGYFSLNHNPSQPRDGAKLQIDRFFAKNNGLSKSRSQNSSTGSHPSIHGRTAVFTVPSSMTVSSQSFAQSHSTASTGEEPTPPRFIQTGLRSVGSKVAPLPLSGYSMLGIDGVIASSSSSKGSKSSSSSGSSKSKKDKVKQKLNQVSRVSTPSPCDYVPVKNLMTPNSSPSQFNYIMPQDLPKPLTQRHRVPHSYSAHQNHNHVVVVQDTVARRGSTGGLTFAGRQSSFRPTTSNLVSPEKLFDGQE